MIAAAMNQTAARPDSSEDELVWYRVMHSVAFHLDTQGPLDVDIWNQFVSEARSFVSPTDKKRPSH